VNRLAPISCYRRFHLKDERFTNRKTSFVNNYNDLHKAIHSHSALCLRYSNLLGQEAKQDEGKPKNHKHADSESPDPNPATLEDVKKLGLFARFKKMAKDYWYVLIPVHVVTSCVWLGSFYYISVSGVDIIGIMEHYEFSESIVDKLKNSRLGHVAIAYFLYKVATPARYFVTLGGTTFAINILSKRNIIKPMPSRDKLVQIYKDKKDDLQQKVADKKQAFQDKYGNK